MASAPNPQTAILTGAASGIARHFAGVLAARDDFNLVLADINEEGLRAAFTPGDRLLLSVMDVRDPAEWERITQETLRRFGRIDYLFNIAGAGRANFFLNQPLENIDWIVDLNLKGPLYGMRIVGEVMARQGSGHIINVGSLAGLTPTPGTSLYSAAKGGLRLASIAAAVELHARGVAITTISPDVVDTPLSRSHASGGGQFGLINSGVKLSVVDLEHAFLRAMRDRPFEINLPRWRGWLCKLGFVSPALLNALYGVMSRHGERRLARERAAGVR